MPDKILIEELKKKWMTTKQIRIFTGWSLVEVVQWIFHATMAYPLAERQVENGLIPEFKIIQEEDYER